MLLPEEVGSGVEDDHYGGIGRHIEHDSCGGADRPPHWMRGDDLVVYALKAVAVVRVMYGPLSEYLREGEMGVHDRS
jgi:hypothetical protein